MTLRMLEKRKKIVNTVLIGHPIWIEKKTFVKRITLSHLKLSEEPIVQPSLSYHSPHEFILYETFRKGKRKKEKANDKTNDKKTKRECH